MTLATRLLIPAALAATAATTAAAQDGETLSTAVDANFPPHASQTMSGELEGFNIDLGNAIAEELGVEIDIAASNFSGLIPAMNAGRYDFLLAPVTATEERAQNMLFTEGYIYTAYQFGVAPNGPTIESYDDLDGLTIVVNQGSAYDAWAQENAADYGAELMVVDTFTNATTAVAQGRADAQLGGNTTIRYAATRNPNFEPSFELDETRSHWSIAVAQNNPELRQRLDVAIECLKMDGTLAQMSEEWFGVAPAEDSAERTVFPGYGVPGLAGYDDTDHDPECSSS